MPQSPTHRPDQLYFFLGHEGPSYVVQLRTDGLWSGTCMFEEVTSGGRRFETTPQQWEEFWLAVERAGVWSWRHRYENFDVLDGQWWTLKLRHGSRSISVEGLNAYPGSDGPHYTPDSAFGQLLQALEHLAGPVQPEQPPITA